MRGPGIPPAASPAAPNDAAGGTPRTVDLHSHSTASDGALPPADVVAAAQRAGLTALALTDHDTVAGVAAAEEEGSRRGVRVIAGTELSAHDGPLEVHLLGLHLQQRGALAEALERFRVQRLERAEAIVRKLQGMNVGITMDAVLAQSAGGAVGRPHVARAMIAAGAARDHREAFDRFLATGRPAFVPKALLRVEDAIRLVHEAGGLAIYAHPGADGGAERIERFAAAGLDGIEVLHPSHNPEDVKRLTALADRFRLVRSGGSDWHGASEGLRTLGALRVPLHWLEEQDARVAARRSSLG